MNWTKRILTKVRLGTKGPESRVSKTDKIFNQLSMSENNSICVNGLTSDKLRVLTSFNLLSIYFSTGGLSLIESTHVQFPST